MGRCGRQKRRCVEEKALQLATLKALIVRNSSYTMQARQRAEPDPASGRGEERGERRAERREESKEERGQRREESGAGRARERSKEKRPDPASCRGVERSADAAELLCTGCLHARDEKTSRAFLSGDNPWLRLRRGVCVCPS